MRDRKHLSFTNNKIPYSSYVSPDIYLVFKYMRGVRKFHEVSTF